MASAASLTTANKKLAETLAKKGVLTPTTATGTGGAHSTKMPFLGNYCWIYRHWVSQHHTSAICKNMAAWRKEDAMSANTMGGRNANKG
jgi:hypothetical protein